jgi:hypothetical protein
MSRPSLPRALEDAAEQLRRNPQTAFSGPFGSALAAAALELNRRREAERQDDAPAQCLGCLHWQQRGGTILPAGPSCVALSSDPMTPQMRALLLHLALQLARAGAWSGAGCLPLG